MHPINPTRRQLLRGLLATSGAALVTNLPGLAFSATPSTDGKRFILVILRGAMDGLAAVAPYGDPALAALRRPLLTPENQLLKLDSFFGLHPAFTSLHTLYQQSELLVCHAVASPYRKRSHFDAQNVLENGFTLPDETASGWLNRCLPLLPSSNGASSPAIAVGQSVPEVLLGNDNVASWSPPRFPSPNENTLTRLQQLYSNDPFLGERLDQALAANGLIGDTMGNQKTKMQDFNVLVDAAATFLSQDQGPAIAVLESDGWDTHANQGGKEGQLASKFAQLDTGLGRLKKGLGEHWRNTVVAVVTEFGRTAAVNGTQGTDHGTAGVALLLGGAVQGGKMHTDWPGLANGNLYQQRDLAPTTDLRAIFKTVLRDHLGLDGKQIEDSVFPESSKAGYIQGLV